MAATATGSAAAGSGDTAASAAPAAPTVVPAQLGFLAIYNPSLGTTDETMEDQIVYYAAGTTGDDSRSSSRTKGRGNGGGHRHRHRHQRSTSSTSVSSASARNERLRHIGLAQGMVAFGKSFSGNQSVDTVETDKTRVVLHELEPGWWILVSVNLTQLPVAPTTGDSASTSATPTTSSPSVEYSSREVKPAALLLQDLIRAHAIFLLHHDVSLTTLFSRVTPRSRFTSLLARYWDIFLSSWTVLLHGNPLRDVLPGVRMAACGELGIGVGEEDRGSGEREVLEGIVEQTDGLVDLVVCKFGDEEKPSRRSSNRNDKGNNQDDDQDDDDDDDDEEEEEADPWLGTGRSPGAEDGAIFLGVGAVTRPSLRTLTYWLEDVYTWGPDAYGLAENPSAPRPPPAARGPTKRRKKSVAAAAAAGAAPAMGSISEQPSTAPPSTTSSTELSRSHTLQTSPPPSRRRPSRSQQPAVASSSSSSSPPPLLPPPPVTQLARRAKPTPVPSTSAAKASAEAASSASPDTGGAMDKYMSYMKLGYGTYWSLTGSVGGSADGPSDEPADTKDKLAKNKKKRERIARNQRAKDLAGQYLIGLVEEVVSKKGASETAAIVKEDGAGDADGEEDKLVEVSPVPEQKKYVASTPPWTVVVELATGTEETARPISQDTFRGFNESRPDDNSGRETTPSSAESEKNASADSGEQDTATKTEKLRLVVYAKRPFLSAFLFKQRPSPAAAADSTTADDQDVVDCNEKEGKLQLLLSQQLSVLHKHLLHSTASRPHMPNSASGAEALLAATASALGTAAAGSSYDLIWDPLALTIHSTIPNIPEPWPVATAANNSTKGSSRQRSTSLSSFVPTAPAWSRVEALNTHMQALNLYTATRANPAELERTCKTSRAWWVVWNRIVERSGEGGGGRGGRQQSHSSSTSGEVSPTSGNSSTQASNNDDDDRYSTHSDSTINNLPSRLSLPLTGPGSYIVTKEIFLIRRASDHSDIRRSSIRAASSTYPDSGDVGERGWTDGASRLAQGIGGDTKRYLEGLLSLNR